MAVTARPAWVVLTLAAGLVASPKLQAQSDAKRQSPRKSERNQSLPSRGVDSRTRLERGAAPRLFYGSIPLPVPAPTRAPFLDPDDGQPCLAVETFQSFGVDARPDIATRSVVLRRPGTSRPVVLPARSGPAGRQGLFVRLSDAARALGGHLVWDAPSRVGTVLAVLEESNVEDGALVLRTSLPVVPRLSTETQTGKLVVELPGTVVGDPVATRLKGDRSPRLEQVDSTTTRLTLETDRPADFSWGALPDGRQLVVGIGVAEKLRKLAESRSLPEQLVEVAAVPALMNLSIAPAALRPNAGVKSIRLAGNDARFDMLLGTRKLPAVRPRLETNRLSLDFPDTAVAQAAAEVLGGPGNPLVKAMAIDPVGQQGARLSIELNQPSRYSLRLDPKGAIKLSLAPLPSAEIAPLAGKTIVVDPGHGGDRSPGARGVDGRFEKTHTLPMGRMLAEALEGLGANVVMTRDTDADPGLSQRGPIANRTGADLFVSIHCNHAGGNRSANGAIVFYHGPSPTCRLFADAITDRLRSDVGAVRTQPSRSDRTVYRSGFAVLRTSAMVGVLVETGFISNPKDAAALGNPNVQRQISAAVAQGILDFFAANPDLDTRNVKPQKDNDPGVLPEEEPDLPPAFLPELPPPGP